MPVLIMPMFVMPAKIVLGAEIKEGEIGDLGEVHNAGIDGDRVDVAHKAGFDSLTNDKNQIRLTDVSCIGRA